MLAFWNSNKFKIVHSEICDYIILTSTFLLSISLVDTLLDHVTQYLATFFAWTKKHTQTQDILTFLIIIITNAFFNLSKIGQKRKFRKLYLPPI